MPPLELLGRRGGNETKHTTKSRFTYSLPVLNPQYTCARLFLNLKVCFQLVDLFHELPDDVSPLALAFFNVAQFTFFRLDIVSCFWNSAHFKYPIRGRRSRQCKFVPALGAALLVRERLCDLSKLLLDTEQGCFISADKSDGLLIRCFCGFTRTSVSAVWNWMWS